MLFIVIYYIYCVFPTPDNFIFFFWMLNSGVGPGLTFFLGKFQILFYQWSKNAVPNPELYNAPAYQGPHKSLPEKRVWIQHWFDLNRVCLWRWKVSGILWAWIIAKLTSSSHLNKNVLSQQFFRNCIIIYQYFLIKMNYIFL